MEKNIQFGKWITRALALGEAVMIIGSHAPVKAEGNRECSKIEYSIAFNVRPEYLEEFKKIVNNKYNDGMTQIAFMSGYMTLNEFSMVNQRRASVKVKNGEEVTISDFEDYSVYCEDSIDRSEIHKNIEETVALYNKLFVGRKLASVVDANGAITAVVESLGTKISILTPGGIWLNNNAGYASIKEAVTLYVEERLSIDSEFAAIWWKYFDKKTYNETNKFVLKECMREVLNNAECLSPIETLIDTYLELTNRIQEANRMIPVLVPDNCSGFVYDETRNVIAPFTTEEQTEKTRRA